MNRRHPLIIGAGILLLLASGITLFAEFGPELGIPVELGVGPIIGIALLSIIFHSARRARPV